MDTRFLRCGLASLLALCVAACIPIPYKPSASVTPDATRIAAPEFVVSCSDDEQTEAVAEEINDRDEQIKTLSHRDVAAVALPEGDTELGKLVAPAVRARLQQDYGVTYLVLVGELSNREISHLGGFIPLLGLGTFKQQKGVTASVIDLASGEPLGGMSASTEGRLSGAIYGFYGLFLVPMMDTSINEAVAKGAVQAIRSRTPEGPVSVIVAHVHGFGGEACEGVEDCTIESAP